MMEMPRRTYRVRVIEGQVVDGEKSERIANEYYTTASSEKQAVNNIRRKARVLVGRRAINGFGDYSYTRFEVE